MSVHYDECVYIQNLYIHVFVVDKHVLLTTCFLCITNHRPAYTWLKKLKDHFPGTPVMALTATATPEVVGMLKDLLGDPLCEMASINKPNISYEVHKIKQAGK